MPSSAAWYCEAYSLDDIVESVEFARMKKLPILVLGGGSNLVLSADLDCLVLANCLSGHVWSEAKIEIAAGENWHDFVSQAVTNGIGGFENLALIPGKAGAAPMQNIGAYGLELADRLLSLQAIHLETGEQVEFDRADCRLRYRDSRFKQERLWCITSISLESSAELRADYPGIQAYLDEQQLDVTHDSIYKAVCELRQAKLPSVISHPNAGSFFKNPIVSIEQADELMQRFPGMPNYPAVPGVKLSAAWLIDQAGLKGAREGGFMVSEQHALVIVHDQNSGYPELAALVSRIRNRITEEFGIVLDIEPIIYPG